jgi:ABC-2 type transport system permease protein
MRFFSVLRKNLLEQSRDPLVLSLTLSFAPLMVLVYQLFFPGGSTAYKVAMLNQDTPVLLEDGSQLAAGEGVMAAMQDITYANGDPLIQVSRVGERAQAETQLRDRDIQVLLIIPENFSVSLLNAQQGRQTAPCEITFVGDLTNPYYAVAGVMANAALEQYVRSVTGLPQPVQIVEVPLGASAARSEFEVYVPGLLVFSVIMLVFQASMTIAREVESGTLRRLQITRMTAIEYLGGDSVGLCLTGVASILLTFAVALAVGFRSQGSLWLAALVGAVTSLSMVGMGLIVAAFSRTVTQAFLIANFPLAFCMFFTGVMFPVAKVTLITIGGRAIGLFDLLPPTHAVTALNKVLTLGAGAGEVAFELGALFVLSLLYYAIGVWLFQRTHLKV